MKENKKINMAPFLSFQNYGKDQVRYILNPPGRNDKWLLNDIQKALDIIDSAERISVIGDYDFDGISSTVIMVRTLQKIGKKVNYFIPNRFKDGYGLNVNLVQKAFDAGSDTILTVDNGIAAYDAIQFAKDLGFKVIVSDHHNIVKLPPADAVVHPALGNYPFASISGCQVSYKISEALLEKKGIHDKEMESYFLQLSAMSIVSDVMPVASVNMKYNENRQWLIDGVESINKRPAKHIEILMRRYNFLIADETVIGFYLVPCINAVGRLADAAYAVKYFLSDDIIRLEEMADRLVINNEKRKELVEKQMKLYPPVYSADKKAVFVVGDEIHEGIAGLIAGKHSSGKGTVSFCFTKCTKENGDVFYKGSGRNDTDISLVEMLGKVPEGIMLGYGGHKDACGLSVRTERMNDFIRFVSEFADSCARANKQFVMNVSHNELRQITSFVRCFKPFGNGLKAPVIQLDMRIRSIMTTRSGFVKIATGSSEDSIDMWLKEPEYDFYKKLESASVLQEYPSGAVLYNTDMMVTATAEVCFSPKKNENISETSYNCLKIAY